MLSDVAYATSESIRRPGTGCRNTRAGMRDTSDSRDAPAGTRSSGVWQRLGRTAGVQFDVAYATSESIGRVGKDGGGQGATFGGRGGKSDDGDAWRCGVAARAEPEQKVLTRTGRNADCHSGQV
jgi:hypothetical protein